MSFSSLLGLPAGLQVLSFDLVNHVLVMQVASTTSESACPVCQSHTSRMHSHYSRKAADLACGGHQVQLILHVRKFFCTNPDCSRKIFAQRLTAFLEPWARVTTRLSVFRRNTMRACDHWMNINGGLSHRRPKAQESEALAPHQMLA